MKIEINKSRIKDLLEYKLSVKYDADIASASDEQLYRVIAETVNELLQANQVAFTKQIKAKKAKKVHYLCMEFLMGRGLKNNLFNMGLLDMFTEILTENNIKTDNIIDFEPDAGIGNGGLGRLGACFLDALSSGGYPAYGYSICYEFGIFRQKIIDGWQTELPDNWLDGGDVWLNAQPANAVDVKFGGRVEQRFDNGRLIFTQEDFSVVHAVPYDMYVSGYDKDSVATLRLYKAEAQSFDMQLFNNGNFLGAMEENSIAQLISKILYPNDNFYEGKKLRLRQQYFMTCASISDILKSHLAQYGTVANFAQKNAIHINDTHPAIAIAEFMRILLDECGFEWEEAWEITKQTFAYTNHTVMAEALEVWNADLVKEVVPRIHMIICEINRRFIEELEGKNLGGDVIERMSIVSGNKVRMANLAVHGSHCVNGVSGLHSEIIKETIFNDFYKLSPFKFTNVTNGIAYRRWLQQGNPMLYKYLCELCGGDVSADYSLFDNAKKFITDKKVITDLNAIKRANKVRFADYIKAKTGTALNPDSIFDVQVKRLHEYKRQHLNLLHIISLYNYIKENPSVDIQPQTFIFGAKAAPGYFLAKEIIRLIWSVGKMIENDPATRDKIKIIYLEDYNVTTSEILMPASDVSEQISLAGTEASGTGNMKLMLNGAVTIGTMDGANVEIFDHVGNDNIFIFGMNAQQVTDLKKSGYNPRDYYNSNPVIKQAMDLIGHGIEGNNFGTIMDNMIGTDPYMVMADFDDYARAHRDILDVYKDPIKFGQMSFTNIANAGFFAADRSIGEYAENIWGVKKI